MVTKMSFGLSVKSGLALVSCAAVMASGLVFAQQLPPVTGAAVQGQTAGTEISPLGRVLPDFIQMGNGERKALDIETISKLNEEISRKEFESKLRELFKIEDQQLGVPPPLPEVKPEPVVEKAPEPVVIPPKLVGYTFDSVFGALESLRAEVKRSDGKIFPVKAGAANDEFKVHDLTSKEIDIQFCDKSVKKGCQGERFKMKLGQVVVFEEKAE